MTLFRQFGWKIWKRLNTVATTTSKKETLSICPHWQARQLTLHEALADNNMSEE